MQGEPRLAEGQWNGPTREKQISGSEVLELVWQNNTMKTKNLSACSAAVCNGQNTKPDICQNYSGVSMKRGLGNGAESPPV